MIFGFGILATALLLSIVAAYYSVAGLTAIFSAATIPVIIMGGSLELGKIVATVWLHNNWKRAGWAFKAYLIPAVAFLMLLTSMGIFGYLSKAHSDQSLVSGDSMAKVAIYDEKIKTEKDNVDANRKALKQLDEAVDQVMGRSTDEKGADKAVAIRRGQQKERSRLLAEISESQKRITTLNEERAPLANEFRKVEAEVGPIKYIAALVYGDNPDANILEKAVRLVIILIVMVFDPLALTLILAANKQFEWARQGKGGFVHDEPAYPGDDGPIDPAVLDQLRERAKEDLPQGPVIAKSSLFSDDPINCYKCGTELINAPGIGLFCPNKICDVVDGPLAEESILDKHPYLLKPFEHFKNLKPMVYNPELEKMNDRSAVHDDEVSDEGESPELKSARAHWKELNPTDTLKNQRSLLARGEIAELPWMQYIKAAPTSSFGPAFPDAPVRGDSFVRTDVAPNQLFKFNGDRWILVDKSTADNYTYDTAYIDHLIDKINAGSYDVDLLSASEQEQVAQRLEQKSNT
jgi:hypothetical protein